VTARDEANAEAVRRLCDASAEVIRAPRECFERAAARWPGVCPAEPR
jgi:hypothetical protein